MDGREERRGSVHPASPSLPLFGQRSAAFTALLTLPFFACRSPLAAAGREEQPLPHQGSVRASDAPAPEQCLPAPLPPPTVCAQPRTPANSVSRQRASGASFRATCPTAFAACPTERQSFCRGCLAAGPSSHEGVGRTPWAQEGTYKMLFVVGTKDRVHIFKIITLRQQQ